MKKEYNKPEIEIVTLKTEEIMETGGISLSSINPNDKQIEWDSENWG